MMALEDIILLVLMFFGGAFLGYTLVTCNRKTSVLTVGLRKDKALQNNDISGLYYFLSKHSDADFIGILDVLKGEMPNMDHDRLNSLTTALLLHYQTASEKQRNAIEDLLVRHKGKIKKG